MRDLTRFTIVVIWFLQWIDKIMNKQEIKVFLINESLAFFKK